MGIQPPVYREGIRPFNPSGLINPTDSTNVFRVGLKSHTVFQNAGHVAQGEALDRRRIEDPRVDRVNAGPLIHQSGTWLKGVIIMVRSNATWLTEERWIGWSAGSHASIA